MEKKKMIIQIVALVLAGLLSFFAISKLADRAIIRGRMIEKLDEKKTTVMELTGAAAGCSTALTMLPGDVGTPIAEQLADLSGGFLAVLCAIYIEKYFLTVSASVVFKFLVPIAIGFMITNILFGKERFLKVGMKIMVFAMLIFAVVPASVWLSGKIEENHQEQIQATLDEAKESMNEVQDEKEEIKEDTNLWNSIINGIQNAADTIGEVISTEVIGRFKVLLGNFVDAVAVLVVTSCVLPVAVLFFFIWLTNLLFGLELKLPNRKKIPLLRGIHIVKNDTTKLEG